MQNDGKVIKSNMCDEEALKLCTQKVQSRTYISL